MGGVLPSRGLGFSLRTMHSVGFNSVGDPGIYIPWRATLQIVYTCGEQGGHATSHIPNDRISDDLLVAARAREPITGPLLPTATATVFTDGVMCLWGPKLTKKKAQGKSKSKTMMRIDHFRRIDHHVEV